MRDHADAGDADERTPEEHRSETSLHLGQGGSTRGRRHDADDPFLVFEQAEIDVKRPGKEQHRQHALHQRAVEVDLPHHVPERFGEPECGKGGIDRQQRHGRTQRHDQQADRVRQFQDLDVQPAEQGRKRQQQRGDLEFRHDAPAIRI